MKLRVALLEKKESVSNGCFDEQIIDCAEKWVVLGHFDVMHTYCLDTDDLLLAIKENNKLVADINKEDAYYSPICMISKDDDNSFWSMCTPFLTIIRVHFSANASFTEAHKKLREKLKKESFLERCMYRIYNSLELSDAIIAIKSNSLSDVLKLTCKIKQYLFVGEVYPYSTIYMDIIKKPLECNITDVIDLITFRLSISHSNNIKQIIELFRRKFVTVRDYLTNGMDDILLTVPNVAIKDLINFYYDCFFKIDERSNHKSSLITRIGISFDNIETKDIVNDSKNPTNKLQNICYDLIEKNKSIQKKICDLQKNNLNLFKIDWNDTLTEIVKLLLRMSKNSVLDEFVFLILPSMYAFLTNIDISLNGDISTVEKNFFEKQCYIQEYLQSTTELAEQIMRTERQLSHNPELRPIMYDIPIAILEYALAVLTQCSKLLTYDDNNKNKINFLLLPKMCRYVETTEIFSATEEASGLVVINIPFALLYEPKKLISNLIHEISHFIGEKHRYRKERLNYYIKSCSVLFSKLFLKGYSEDAIEQVVEKLLNEFHKTFDNCDNLKMKDMRSVINIWSEDIIQSDGIEAFSDLIRCIVINSENGFDLTFNSDEYMSNYYQFFRPLTFNVSMLFREVYADLCMLYFLPISASEYVELIYENVYDEIPENDISSLFIIRMYICLAASNRNFFELKNSKNTELSRISTQLEAVYQDINSETENPKAYYPTSVIIQILEYAKLCYNSLSDFFNEEDIYQIQKKDIKDFYNKFRYDDYLNTIDNYRELIIDELNKSK